MIVGQVNGRHEIIIALPVRDSTGHEHELEEILDTGFTGSLTAIGCREHEFTLALSQQRDSGKWPRCGTDIHVAAVVWHSVERQILVQAIENAPLLGMTMLVGFDLRARVVESGRVEIEAVS